MKIVSKLRRFMIGGIIKMRLGRKLRVKMVLDLKCYAKKPKY